MTTRSPFTRRAGSLGQAVIPLALVALVALVGGLVLHARLLEASHRATADHALRDYAAVTDLTSRAAAYGIRAEKVDGFDTVATYRALDEALRSVRAGDGPVFVECITYRLTGHSGTILIRCPL